MVDPPKAHGYSSFVTEASSTARIIAASADVVSRVVDGEAVLLDLESGKYFGLNEVGSFVWERIQTPASTDDLLSALHDAFDVDMDTLRADLDELVTDLEAKGLVSVETRSA